ncbi:MAG TPA: hypothetical protein VGT98_12090 [Candidatus Elarobacter sp.]|nr:hypothetical protein [Candidatus Elarobacter sp.]HEV2738722.1 hypothetical protein [Candidatus Elarobacter sp.]
MHFFARCVGRCAGVAEGRFDEQHRGVEREDRRVGRRDLADQRALRGVAFAAEDLAHDELALYFAMAAAPDEIGEVGRVQAFLRYSAAAAACMWAIPLAQMR